MENDTPQLCKAQYRGVSLSADTEGAVGVAHYLVTAPPYPGE